MAVLKPEDIVARLPSDKTPPVHLWHPDRYIELDIRIGRDGSWYYLGSRIDREAMVKLFSTVLRQDPDERYYLVTPVEKIAITVDAAPFVAVEMTVHGAGRDQVLTFRTNVDDELMAGPEHPIRIESDAKSGEPSPYVHVRARLEALISRPVYYQMADLAVIEASADGPNYGVWSAGEFFALGEAEQDDLRDAGEDDL